MVYDCEKQKSAGRLFEHAEVAYDVFELLKVRQSIGEKSFCADLLDSFLVTLEQDPSFENSTRRYCLMVFPAGVLDDPRVEWNALLDLVWDDDGGCTVNRYDKSDWAKKLIREIHETLYPGMNTRGPLADPVNTIAH